LPDGIVSDTVEPSRQERFLDAVAKPKKGRTFTDELNHLHLKFLVSACVKPIRGAASLPDNVYQTLRSLGAPEECLAIGGRFDGSEVELHKALHESGDGFLLSCIPGKLAFVKTEDEEFFLQRK
jgi:hypothetical protein